ncbi:CvpA family protein [Kangiella sp. TOML190]|uniref:CvpA family protein n=1 Tax=Kangiella sp. TOML190 TaxID=2931351 RepID=UPI00203E8CE2|nr:CvpA family protein [Kangiella sp. TOML190]
MVWVDWAILAIIGLSALISLMRGFVREALSLAGWIAAFLLAKTFYEPVAQMLVEHIETNSLRLGVAWVSIFIITLFIAGVINYMIGKMIDKAGLSGTDRFLGMGFGALRGVLIVALIILGLRQFTPVPKDDWWGESKLIPHMEVVAEWFYDKLGDVVDIPELEKNQSNKSPEDQPMPLDPIQAKAQKALLEQGLEQLQDSTVEQDDSDQ